MARQFIIGSDYKTKVTIKPSFEIDMQLDECCIPAAFVEICILNAEDHSIFEASFWKVLNNNPILGDPDAIIQHADDLISGDLAAIGLNGLRTLDIHNDIPFSISDFIQLLESRLDLRYYCGEDMHSIKDIGGTNIYPTDGFYNLVFNGLKL